MINYFKNEERILITNDSKDPNEASNEIRIPYKSNIRIYIYNLILLSLINSLPKLYIYPNKIDPITLNIYTLPYNIRYIT